MTDLPVPGGGTAIAPGFRFDACFFVPGAAGWMSLLFADFAGLTVNAGLSASAANDAVLTTSKLPKRDNQSKWCLCMTIPSFVKKPGG
jgi:hypothetical protein